MSSTSQLHPGSAPTTGETTEWTSGFGTQSCYLYVSQNKVAENENKTMLVVAFKEIMKTDFVKG